MPSPVAPLSVRFGDFEFDSTRGVLLREDVALKLQPQPFKVLHFLLDRAPAIVTREELGEYIWGREVHVDLEQSINFCVRQIRSVLNDSASTPRYLEHCRNRVIGLSRGWFGTRLYLNRPKSLRL